MKRLLIIFLVLGLLLAACSSATQEEPAAPAEEPAAPAEEPAAPAEEPAEEPAAAEEFTMATVVKLTGVGWFDRMEEGVADFEADHEGVTAFQQGPSQADAALQVQVLEDLVAQGVDSLCVIPFQPETVEPVLQRARDQGIVVVSHEASNQQNVDFDIEAFDNAAYGRHLMDYLAGMMGEEGEYVVFVGSLTSTTHNEWIDAAIEHQKATYPNMTLVGDKNESYDDAQTAYERMKELLVAYPNLKGMQGSSANDVVGAGQAVEEAGLNDEIAVVGTSLASMSGALLETGAVDLISFWDPAMAGYACNQLALMKMQGEEPTEGMDLGLEGYESITSADGKVWYGQAWVDVTKDNLADWNF